MMHEVHNADALCFEQNPVNDKTKSTYSHDYVTTLGEDKRFKMKEVRSL